MHTTFHRFQLSPTILFPPALMRYGSLSMVQIVSLNLLLAFVYYGAARLGLLLQYANSQATPVWPASGIAIGAVLLFGTRPLPGIFIGAFAANLMDFYLKTGISVSAIFGSVAIGLGNMGEAWVASVILRPRLNERFISDTQSCVLTFGVGVLLAGLVSASIGVSALMAFGFLSPSIALTVIATWWVGDVVGALILAPPVLWFFNGFEQWTSDKRIVLIALAGVAILSAVTFWDWDNWAFIALPAYIVIPASMILALRYGRSIMMPTMLLVAAVAIIGTIHGLGPFADVDRNFALISLQAFVGTLAVALLLLDSIRQENQRALAALERSNAIIESSDDAIISKTLDGHVTSWNTGAEALFGYRAKEMLGQPLTRLFPLSKQNEESFTLQKISEGERVEHFETAMIRKDGSAIDVSVTISPIRDTQGKIIGASKIARDITEKKLSEIRLQLLSCVFTNTREGVVITDSSGLIVEVNDAFCHDTGYARDEVLGHLPNILMSSRQGHELMASIQTDLKRRDCYQGEVWGRRKTGESFPALLAISSVRNRFGKIQNYVAVFNDITPLRTKQERLEHLANYDALTDLPNRILLADRLSQAMTACRRQKQILAVLYLDLDGFKKINDTYGHDIGDELLVAVSHVMRHMMRDGDTLARIGGDEFVAILVNVRTTYYCEQLVERILSACEKPVIIRDHEFNISASIGVTMYPQSDGKTNADELLRQADRAMYEAKQAGRNRYHLFNATFEDEIQLRVQEIKQIQRGFEKGEFTLWYQPKVNMRTGAVLGFEALMRWIHPERGVLSPACFLPLIGGSNLSERIGKWALEQALQQMDKWQAMDISASVSVNIGAQHLQNPQFPSFMAKLLGKYHDINPSNVELEILESSAVEDIDMACNVIRECQALGVRFAVDDFGTGYSSLTYLRRLPAETLKIDQNFVTDMLSHKDNVAIISSIVNLAASFGREVIAEGVETKAVGTKLLELGCEQAQGYAIARPMPSDQIKSWMNRWHTNVRANFSIPVIDE
jgi:diguanylate cyclase (GGDEF)-like protein/PAS domain S-box-containing protein